MRRNPTGQQWTIRYDDQEATIVEVGGGLRTYRLGATDVLAGYGAEEICRSGRGQVLMPWPNRIRDGKYSFNGTEQQLALTEPPQRNAIHGLVRWTLWSMLEQANSRLVMGYRLHPQQGWSGHLDLTVAYELGEDGLTVVASATNVGPEPAPFGYGAHPYIAIGDQPLGSVVVKVPADLEVLVDDRQVPTGTAPVGTQGPDLRTAGPLEETRLDAAFTGLARDPDGLWRVRVGGLEALDHVTVWADEHFDWVQVFTAQGEDIGVNGARGVAVEPMSCPADAFNSGDGLVVLQPGESWSGTWGLVPAAIG